jgi:DNA-binding NtrC family response regulator
MISGEPGSGKDLTARLLHQASARRDKPFIDVSLAAIPSADVPVQLFGSEFNGVITTGRFEEASGGTLLLDEIADLDMATQTKLANALEQGQFARAGGSKMLNLDVRILSASNQNIEHAVQQSRFREDLYYRLNVVPLRVPPLREHREDIPALIEYYIEQIAQREGLALREVSEGALTSLSGYDWPGNVRELKNVVQRILIFNQGDTISASEIREALHDRVRAAEPLDQADFNSPLREAREHFERSYFSYHLDRLNGNISELANVVGMERTNLYRKLKGLGIDPKARK